LGTPVHREGGEAMEALYPARRAEHCETLAHHYEQAEEWEHAHALLVQSGEKALGGAGPRHSASYYERALAPLDRAGKTLQPEAAVALYFGLGQARFLIGEWDRSAASFQ